MSVVRRAVDGFYISRRRYIKTVMGLYKIGRSTSSLKTLLFKFYFMYNSIKNLQDHFNIIYYFKLMTARDHEFFMGINKSSNYIFYIYLISARNSPEYLKGSE